MSGINPLRRLPEENRLAYATFRFSRFSDRIRNCGGWDGREDRT